MAYMNQERKNELATAIKSVLKKYNVKATISVRNHSTLVVTIAQSGFEIDGHRNVNVYHIDSNYSGEIAEFLNELRSSMMTGNHNRSDSMTDLDASAFLLRYFDVGWYIDIQFGRWNKPHQVRRELATV